MDGKLILFEPRNLLLKTTKSHAPEDIARRMMDAEPRLKKAGLEKVTPLVMGASSDFCAYSNAQAHKKLSGAIREAREAAGIGLPANQDADELWTAIVDAYIKATEETELNMDLVELISELRAQNEGVFTGVLANGFWFSTPLIKAQLPEGLFDLFFQSGDLRCRKPWSQLYDMVENITNISGGNILLLDGDYKSVIEARNHGWMAELADANTSPEIFDAIFNQFLTAGATPLPAIQEQPKEKSSAPAGVPAPKEPEKAGEKDAVSDAPAATDDADKPKDVPKAEEPKADGPKPQEPIVFGSGKKPW